MSGSHGIPRHASIVSEAGATPELNTILQTLTDRAREIIGAHHAVTSIMIDRDWEQAIDTVSLSDTYAELLPSTGQPDRSLLYTLIGRMDQPIRLTQAALEADPAWRAFSKARGMYPATRNLLVVSLTGRGDRNIGLLYLFDRYTDEFTKRDEAILVQLEHAAAVAIENAWLYQKA